MSWMKDLYDVYERNQSLVGTSELNKWEQEVTLLPISFTTQTAHIQIDVTEDGEFLTARVLGKNDDRITMIPCTLESASRAAGVAPYPLHDKLCYVAGDFELYGGTVKKENPYEKYMVQLKKWVESIHTTKKLNAIYVYLKKGMLIRDLVKAGVLFVDSDGHLIEKWDHKYEVLHGEKPPIFNTVASSQLDAFVRFNVYSTEENLDNIWKDTEINHSFINFYNDILQERETGICYLTGKVVPLAELHANKIRNSGDKSKLISANDKTGFTYRGRFETSQQALTIGYEASQKAHNALKWLVGRQGESIGQRVFLVWGTSEIPTNLNDDPFPFIHEPNEITPSTSKDYAETVSKAIKGYRSNLDTKESVSILILDAATTGRLAVTYYQKLHKELYLNRLEKWYEELVWIFKYKNKDTNKTQERLKTPTPKEIANGAYGNRDEKLIKQTIERLLLCMIEGQKEIPKDIERSLIQRASRPSALETWEWEQCLSVACATIKKNSKKEVFDMALDVNCTDRSYLFGRLLAVADVAERTALNQSGEKRETNAMRYMTTFSNQPEKTWNVIHNQLHPYLIRLKGGSKRYTDIIGEITDQLGTTDFTNDRLEGKYLVGFYSQRLALYQKNQDDNENK